MTELEKITQTIAALEAQRALLGEAVVDTALLPLREKQAKLQAAADRQRKLASILFCDIVDSTKISEDLDPEDALSVMDGALSNFKAIVEQQQGRITRFMGDGLKAIFGLPAAREDDAERAVRAGLDILEAARAYADEVNACWGWGDFNVRVGINTGWVVTGGTGTEGANTVSGDAVNLAARMERHAPIGGLLISHETYCQVRGLFEVQMLPPLVVKGKVEPVQTYLVKKAKPRVFRLPTRGIEGIATRMIGREAELKQLGDAVQATWNGGGVQMVTVTGEAGLGKSRLLDEFRHWLELRPEKVRVFHGRANETMQQAPYGLLRDVFAFRFEIQDSDPPAVAREKLEQGVVGFMGPQGAEAAHFIGHLLGMDFSTSRFLRGILDDAQQVRDYAFLALARFFKRVARDPGWVGAVLILDDLHWADESSLDVLTYLQQECQAAAFLILCLARPILFERRPTWGTAGLRLDLAPLSEQAAALLVGEILQKLPVVPPALSELVVGGAEGNPFYIEELIKMLIDKHIIIPTATHWQALPERLTEVQVPPTLTGVLQARLDSLTPSERETLQRAAIIGRVFWAEAVSFLSLPLPNTEAQPAVATTVAALATLLSKELIFQRETSTFAGTREYIFKHTLLRDVTYKTVLKQQRLGYHAQAAAWLVARSQGRAEEYAALIAEHYEQAGDLAQAAVWYGRAGDQARAGCVMDVAIRHYEKAVRFYQHAALAQPQLLLKWYAGWGEALHFRARYTEAVAAYIAMQAAAEEAGEPIAQAQAWLEISFVQNKQGQYRASLVSAERARVLVQMEPEAVLERVKAIFRKGWACFRLGDRARALAFGEEALALCETLGEALDVQRQRARILNLLGGVYQLLGRIDQTEQCQEQALALWRSLGAKRLVSTLLNNLGESARWRGDYAQAATRYQEALAIAREIGNRDGERVFLSNLCGARVGLGQYAEAAADLQAVIAQVGRTDWWLLSETYRFLAEAHLGLGQLAEALAAAQQALVLADETGNKEFLGAAWHVLGKVGCLTANFYVQLPHRAEITEPQFCFAESIRIFTETGVMVERARTLRDWARYALAQGDNAAGQHMWTEARDMFVRLRLPLELARMEQV